MNSLAPTNLARLALRALPVAILLVFANEAQAANALARAIEQAKPCAPIKISKFGLSVGIDQFKSADIRRLHIDVDGDSATVSLSGSLACQTSASALVRGDASAEISATVALNLATCQFSQNAVSIVSTGGSFGSTLAAVKGEIEHAIERGIAKAVTPLCR